MIRVTDGMPLLALGAILLASTGCCNVNCPDPSSLVGVETVVDEYNHNADKAPYLWARAHVKILVHDPATGIPVFRYGDLVGDFNGLVLLDKNPDDPAGAPNFLLKVSEPGGYTVFAMGNSLADGMFHLWYRQNEPKAWIGRTQMAGAAGTGLPIDPLLLANVFTIKPLPELTALPTVVQRIQTQCKCAYVLTYVDRRPLSGKILARSEYVFPWKTKGPGKLETIRFLDPVGMTAMEARIGDYRSIDTSEMEQPPEVPPVLAHRIQLTAFDPKTRNRSMTLEIHLENASTKAVLYSAACRLENAVPSDVLSGARNVQSNRPQ
jgi:hypothetical protein